MCRLNTKLNIATVKIVRTQCLKVRSKLLFGVLIVFGPKTNPVGCLQLEKRLQILFLERLHANKIDLPDFGGVTFVNIKVDRNPITLEGGYCRCDRDPILATSQVLTLQLLFGFFKQTAVKGSGNSKTGILQALDQLIALEFL